MTRSEKGVHSAEERALMSIGFVREDGQLFYKGLGVTLSGATARFYGGKRHFEYHGEHHLSHDYIRRKSFGSVAGLIAAGKSEMKAWDRHLKVFPEDRFVYKESRADYSTIVM